MAGSASDFLENQILEHIFRADYTPPGTAYVGLWTQALTDASAGTAAGEVSGGGYARVAVARGTGTWNAAAGGSIANTAAVNFGTATAEWGTITHTAILNASSGGTILYWMDLTASKYVQNGDTLQFAAGAIGITQT